MQEREVGLTSGGRPLAPAGLSGRNFLGENTLWAMGSRNSGLNSRPPRPARRRSFPSMSQ